MARPSAAPNHAHAPPQTTEHYWTAWTQPAQIWYPPPPAPLPQAVAYGPRGIPRSRSPRRARGAKAALTLPIVLPAAAKYAKEQDGSTFLQGVLSQSHSSSDAVAVAAALMPAVVELSCDMFGNHVVQALLAHSSQALQDVLDILVGRLDELAKDKHGCRVIQKLQELITEGSEFGRLEDEILESIVILSTDQNGNHVIQRALENATPLFVRSSVELLVDRTLELAHDEYGGRVIQRLLSRCNELGMMDEFQPMLQQLIESTLELCQHKCGNYVIQALLDNVTFEHSQPIVEVVRENLAHLAVNKISSNVVEKCISMLASDVEDTFRLQEGSAFTRAVLTLAPELVKDKFGNYIIQTLAKSCVGEDRTLVRESLMEVLDGMDDDNMRERISRAIDVGETGSRPLASLSKPSVQKNSSRDSEEGTRWTCSFCGFKNVLQNEVCGGHGHLGCKAAKPQAPNTAAGNARARSRSPRKEASSRRGNKKHAAETLTLSSVLADIGTHVKDQDGSGFLQDILRNGMDADKTAIFEALLPVIVHASLDEIGNYVVQLLVEQASEEQLDRLADGLLGQTKELAMDTYGRYVLQKMQQVLPSDLQSSLELELGHVFFDLIENNVDNRIVTTAIERASVDFLTFAINALTERIDTLAKSVLGLRILKCLLPRCFEPDIIDIADPMLQNIGDLLIDLVPDEYGNYVVQIILEHGRLEDRRRILDTILGNLVPFSTAKIPSNVVSKFFIIMAADQNSSDRQEVCTLTRAILGESSDDNSPLQKLVENRFGSYVVQNLVTHCVVDDEEFVKRRLSEVLPKILNHNGKCIQRAILKRFGGDPLFADIDVSSDEDGDLEQLPGSWAGIENAATGSANNSKHSNSKNFKTQICKNFLRGTCNFGVRCTYAHGEAELQRNGAPLRVAPTLFPPVAHMFFPSYPPPPPPPPFPQGPHWAGPSSAAAPSVSNAYNKDTSDASFGRREPRCSSRLLGRLFLKNDEGFEDFYSSTMTSAKDRTLKT